MNPPQVSYEEALDLTLSRIEPLGVEILALPKARGRTAASEAISRVDSPSMDVSLKDGYAVKSSDISGAAPDSPIVLSVKGEIPAGGNWSGEVVSGVAVRVLTGAPIPIGAQAVVSEEFTSRRGNQVFVANNSDPGRNVLKKGMDLAKNETVLRAGDIVTPPVIGMLAAAGLSSLKVFRVPKIAILATGDEIIALGEPFVPGKLYASNAASISAWCEYFGMETSIQVVSDVPSSIETHIRKAVDDFDALITSGGVWKGDRDYVFEILTRLGWEMAYRHVRLAPGKSAGFGLLNRKPVFCLPGGPPSNHTALVLLALPGLLKMAGQNDFSLPVVRTRLAKSVRGQTDWTRVIHGKIGRRDGETAFYPQRMESRLKMMAKADAILIVSENTGIIDQGDEADVLLLKL